MRLRWKVGFGDHRHVVLYEDTEDGRWFTLHRPCFRRDEHGWWLAPLIRVERGSAPWADGYMVDVPLVERYDGKLSFRWVS